jgi:hypothetical protein
VAETSCAKCGDISLAYQVFGDGSVELVVVGPFVTHVELFWTMPEFKAFFDQLATFCRVLLFDKAGVGLCAGWPASPRQPTADKQRCVVAATWLRRHHTRNSERRNVSAGKAAYEAGLPHHYPLRQLPAAASRVRKPLRATKRGAERYFATD